MTSGGTMVGKDIPPFIKVAHNPASYVGVNSIGLRRRGFTGEQINEIMDICRIMFQNGYSYGKACRVLEEQMPDSDARREMLTFFAGSKRGPLNLIRPGPRTRTKNKRFYSYSCFGGRQPCFLLKERTEKPSQPPGAVECARTVEAQGASFQATRW